MFITPTVVTPSKSIVTTVALKTMASELCAIKVRDSEMFPLHSHVARGSPRACVYEDS